MMRRNWLAAALLGLALLLGQLGGTLHALSHLAEGDKDRPHAACQLCVAYSAFDHATPAAHAELAAESAEPAGFAPARHGHTPRSILPYAPRAPPRPLA